MLDAVTTAVPGHVASGALADLRANFAQVGHHPSDDQWHALEALLETFDRLVDGRADPALYLSALDPGVGKTSAVIAYLRRLMASPDHRHAGVLLSLSRLGEIERLAKALSGKGVTLAVRTSDDARNALSTVDEVEDAQVLIITQQRLTLVLDGRRLSEARSLYYRGRPRALRIWDESFLPGEAIAMPNDDVLACVGWLRRADAPELREWALRLAQEAENAKDGGRVFVPVWDFADDSERKRHALAPLRALEAQGETLAGKHRETLETLLAMSGRTLSVRRDGRVPMPTLVGYRRTIPDDLLPLVVLDASGRVRTTYDDLATTMPLVRLPAAHKDYSGLTIRVWDRGGGKSSFGTEKAAEPIVSAIADLIESSDDTGRWLVVGHKQVEGRVVDVEGTLRRRLSPAKSALVDFITWGNHAASNDYADASRVVLAGTLFLPRSGYEALKRLCLDRDPDQLALTDDDLTDTEMGEHGHYVLQALCRASVRKAEEGGTRPCTAYIIASKRSGIRNRLPEWFPGCRVESWEPRGPKPLTGHSKMVFDYVTRWAAAKEPGAKLKFSKVYGDLHIHPDVFRDVRANERLKAALAERGITEGGGGKLMTHYTLVARVSESRVSDV